MEESNLLKFIQELEGQNLKEEAYFAIKDHGDRNDDTYISSNKEGLQLYAAQLLKASLDIDKVETVSFDHNEAWTDGDIFIGYIKAASAAEKEEQEYKMTIKDKLLSVSCGLVFLFLITSIVVGIKTIIVWIKT